MSRRVRGSLRFLAFLTLSLSVLGVDCPIPTASVDMLELAVGEMGMFTVEADGSAAAVEAVSEDSEIARVLSVEILSGDRVKVKVRCVSQGETRIDVQVLLGTATFVNVKCVSPIADLVPGTWDLDYTLRPGDTDCDAPPELVGGDMLNFQDVPLYRDNGGLETIVGPPMKGNPPDSDGDFMGMGMSPDGSVDGTIEGRFTQQNGTTGFTGRATYRHNTLPGCTSAFDVEGTRTGDLPPGFPAIPPLGQIPGSYVLNGQWLAGTCPGFSPTSGDPDLPVDVQSNGIDEIIVMSGTEIRGQVPAGFAGDGEWFGTGARAMPNLGQSMGGRFHLGSVVFDGTLETSLPDDGCAVVFAVHAECTGC